MSVSFGLGNYIRVGTGGIKLRLLNIFLFDS